MWIAAEGDYVNYCEGDYVDYCGGIMLITAIN